jgi:hypothetical protein
MKLIEKIRIIIMAALITFFIFNLMVTPSTVKLMKMDQLSGHEIIVMPSADN